MPFDAVLMIAFGGPEQPEDIRPFLQNVLRGRGVSAQRLEEVAHHYELIGGRSPLNELTLAQARALEAACGLKVHVGMRNWRPLLVDTMRQMQDAGVRRACGLIMAPQQSDSSWEKYRRNVAEAIAEAGVNLEVTYARPFFDHPQFIAAAAGRVERELRHTGKDACIVFTAHSVPLSDPFHQRYANQIATSARGVCESLLPIPDSRISYQSRSGRPGDPWLEPDINDELRDLHARGVREVVVCPIGFVCDHVEVLYDLDLEAAQTARNLGLTLRRAKTVEDDPRFIACLADIVRDATEG